MTQRDDRSSDRDRRFREVFSARPINVIDLGSAPPPPLTLSLRRFPFPFRSALAISNDSRTLTPESFEEVQQAFAERDLEVGVALSFDKEDVCSIDSPIAQMALDLGLADQVLGLPEAGVAAACDILDSKQIRPNCYIGNPAVADAAPLKDVGVQFFTDSAFTVGEKFGDALDIRSTIRLREAFGRFDYNNLGVPFEEGQSDLLEMFESRPENQRDLAIALFNSPTLTTEVAARTLDVFKRYRGPQRPSLATLGFQLRSMHLDMLENESGTVIVEQRLGETALLGQAPRDEQRQTAASPILTKHELVALDDLADRSRERLLVALPGRLLNWHRLRTRLRFEVDETSDVWLIRLTAVDGHTGRVSREMLDGLAFTLPADAPETIVLVEGDAQPLETRREPEPRLDGHHCVFLPWEKRSWPIN